MLIWWTAKSRRQKENDDDVAAGATPAAAAKLTGATFMQAIQSGPFTKHIPVILLYTSSASPDATAAIRSGVETILAKPPSKDLLLKKVNQVLTTIAQKKKSELYAERAQAYRTILSSFRTQREEEVKAGKRTPRTPMRKRQLISTTAAGEQQRQQAPSPDDLVLREHKPVGPSSRGSASESTIAEMNRTMGEANGTATTGDASNPSGLSQPVQKRSTSNTFTFDVAAATRARAEFEVVAEVQAQQLGAAAGLVTSKDPSTTTAASSGLPPSGPPTLSSQTSTPPRVVKLAAHPSSGGSSGSLPPDHYLRKKFTELEDEWRCAACSTTFFDRFSPLHPFLQSLSLQSEHPVRCIRTWSIQLETRTRSCNSFRLRLPRLLTALHLPVFDQAIVFTCALPAARRSA